MHELSWLRAFQPLSQRYRLKNINTDALFQPVDMPFLETNRGVRWTFERLARVRLVAGTSHSPRSPFSLVMMRLACRSPQR